MRGSLTFRSLRLPLSGRYRQTSLLICLVLFSISETAVKSPYSATSPAKTHWHANMSNGLLIYACLIDKLLHSILSTGYIESQILGCAVVDPNV